MESYVILWRESGIPLDEWREYVTKSSIIKLAQPRNGINPFNKQPCVFKPAAGAAGFDTAGGHCSIEYKSGELLAFVPDAEAMTIIEQIADFFDAKIKKA